MKLRKRKPGECKQVTISKGIKKVVFNNHKTGEKETYIRSGRKGKEYDRV